MTNFASLRLRSCPESGILLGETDSIEIIGTPVCHSTCMSKALYLHCPVRRIEFNSGITVAPDTLAQIEQIAIRMRCPICRDMHFLIEKGELDEGD
jgi:hypothetical protein